MTAHILLVEDRDALRDALQIILEGEGYRVSAAADGRAALAVATLLRPDLIITDIDMPTMSGIELRRALVLAGETMPVAFMSGRADLRALAAANAAAAIAKPFSVDELLALVVRLGLQAAA